jgi:hypothetical protein
MSHLNLLDCLVLCIDDLSTFKLFILYDIKKKLYELRGKNRNLEISPNAKSEIVSDSDSDSDSGTDFNSEQEYVSELEMNKENDLKEKDFKK